jgi:hypothetical protein
MVEVTGDWRKLRSEKHHDLCPSQNILPCTIQAIKSRRSTGHVARMEERIGE